MGKKVGKILGCIGIILLVIIIFFAVDYIRVKNNQPPIFCIQNPVGEINNEGTREYFGLLGYKVIAFNKSDGYHAMKIGNWSMQYEDLKEEYEKNSKKQYGNLEDISQEYTMYNAISDGYVVITNDKIYNKEVLERFIKNTKNGAEERKEDSIRIVQFTVEGDPIITEISFVIKEESYEITGQGKVNKSNYIVKIDSTRDKFAEIEARKIEVIENLPGEFYGIIEKEEADKIEIRLTLHAQISYVEETTPYKEILIASYSKQAMQSHQEYPYFYGKIVKAEDNYILVQVNASEEEAKGGNDLISVELGKEDKDMLYEVGTNVKVTYTGIIRETYPSQIDMVSIELKSVDDFTLMFHEEKAQRTSKIIDKAETSLYDYNIYSYKGNIDITIEGKTMSLREALLENKITMQEIIAKANQEASKGKIKHEIYKDGGSIEYYYATYTIIKMHTLEGNRDVYIGNTQMRIQDIRVK